MGHGFSQIFTDALLFKIKNLDNLCPSVSRKRNYNTIKLILRYAKN
jgi:hypothetical protein